MHQREEDLILRKRHTGLVVNNIKKSIAFYKGLGLSVQHHEIEEGEFISHVVGIHDAIIETAKLKLLDGSLIELLQYISHPSQQNLISYPSNQHGCSHIAFTVSNIEQACKLVIKLGGSIVNSPIISTNGLVKVAYAHDIDGILMEIVEEID